MSYSTLADIAKQATKDLGFKVEMSVVDHPGLTNRMVNDPKSIDIADMEIWQTKISSAGRDPSGRDREDQGLGRPHAAVYGRRVRREGSVTPGRLADQVHVSRRQRR